MILRYLIGNIHWFQVLLITIFSFALGFVWHSPWLFGKFWKQENYPNNLPIKINAPLVFGGTAVVHFLALAGLSAVVSGQGAIDGAFLGLLIAIVWMVPVMAGTYLFAGRSIKLLLIDAGQYVVLFVLSGFVLGVWS